MCLQLCRRKGYIRHFISWYNGLLDPLHFIQISPANRDIYRFSYDSNVSLVCAINANRGSSYHKGVYLAVQQIGTYTDLATVPTSHQSARLMLIVDLVIIKAYT